MITVTEAAKDRFNEIKSTEHTNGVNGLVLRLEEVQHASSRNVPVGMYVGAPMEGDQIVEHVGEVLIHISRSVSETHDGCVVDLVEKSEGIGFSIAPPMAGQYAR